MQRSGNKARLESFPGKVLRLTMKKLLLSLMICSSFGFAYGWGQTGHRVVGEIAYRHLSKKAKRHIDRILKNESLAMVGTFMDEIRSDPRYDSLSPWHYCTIPDGMTYQDAGIPEQGDVIQGIEKFVSRLKSGSLSEEEELFVLKCLVHLVGDVHQPLHVGNGRDKGGNEVKVRYFGEESNLHWVWDTGIIEKQNVSYTEYVQWINHPTRAQIEDWQSQKLMEWVEESISYRPAVYDLPEDRRLSYLYNFKNTHIVNKRLLQAGIRLAKLLNDIYG